MSSVSKPHRPILAWHVVNGEVTKKKKRLYLARHGQIRNGSCAKTSVATSLYVMCYFSEFILVLE